MAKTELVESLSFTLKGSHSYAESEFSVTTEKAGECPNYDIPDLGPQSKSVFESDVHKHICDDKSAVDTLLVPFIPHVSQDPGINTAEYNGMGHITSQRESITCEKEKVYSFLSDSSCDDSDEVDSKCDDDDDDDDDDEDDDDGEEQEKENGTVTEEEETGGSNTHLNCDAVEFIPSAKEDGEQGEICHREVAGTKSTCRIVSAPAEEIQLVAAASEYRVPGK
jgi:hypothetical protein